MTIEKRFALGYYIKRKTALVRSPEQEKRLNLLEYIKPTVVSLFISVCLNWSKPTDHTATRLC